MIQNPASDVAEVVEYLIACEKTLASLYTLADCLISWQVSLRYGRSLNQRIRVVKSCFQCGSVTRGRVAIEKMTTVRAYKRSH